MPVLPKDGEAATLRDSLSKASKDASSSTDQAKATFEHHKANPGPVIAQNLGEPESKEALKKRAEELNK